MSLIETRYEHVILDEKLVPVIAGTRTRITELILDKIAYGWSPEELQFQHPHLKLGQIYPALAYYSDHQDELDEIIARQLEHVDQMRQQAKPTPLAKKLKAKKLI